MKKEVVVIINGPGLKEVRDKYGHSYDWVRNACNVSDVSFSQSNSYKGQFPNLDDGDGWIITGSAKSAYADIDWIIELEILIKRAYEVQKPILGICFGHQLIAQALGGIVEKNNKGWELGSSTININDRGLISPIFKNILSDDFFYMSHEDVVSKLPPGAIELASNNKGNQSYSIGNFIYGVQFHPEFPYDVAQKYAFVRYQKGLIQNKPIVKRSRTSHNIINNFIKLLESDI